MDRAGANRIYKSDLLVWHGQDMWVSMIAPIEADMSVSESVSHALDEFDRCRMEKPSLKSLQTPVSIGFASPRR